MTILPLLLSVAQAKDCDSRALGKELAAAAPASAPLAFSKLAACDPDAAKKAAPKALPTFLGTDEGVKAAHKAIEVGVDPVVVRTWVQGLQSDEKARALNTIGKSCKDSPAVQGFFLTSAAQLGDTFWEDRWYDGLDSCRVPAVRELLSAQVAKGAAGGRSFVSVLETWARNLGPQAVPPLTEMARASMSDPAQLNLILNAFADAAQVGSTDGTDTETAEAAANAIEGLAPELPKKSVEQARLTLRSLGAEAASDRMARWYYKDQARGQEYVWGAVYVEKATCKNGKKRQAVHWGPVQDDGKTWADQVQSKVEAAAGVGWATRPAEKCKGEGNTIVVVSDQPFADDKALKAWATEKVEAMADPEAKSTTLEHDPLAI